MRKPRSLQDDDAEKTSLQPPWRRDVGAPVPRNEEMPSDEDKSAAAEDASMASSETTPKTGNHSTTSFYSVAPSQSQAMRHVEENDDMTRSLRPASRKLLVENEDDTFPAATGDAERGTKIKATTSPQQVRWTNANEARQEGKDLGVNGGVDETLPFMTEYVGYSVGSMEATKQYAREPAPMRRDPSDYSVASSEASKQYEDTAAAVGHMSENCTSNNVVSRGRAPPPQILPEEQRVSGINSVTRGDQHSASPFTESAQVTDSEVYTSVVSETGVTATAYAVDDQVHETRLVNTKKQCLRRCLWTTALVAIVVVVAVAVPTVHFMRDNGGDNGEIKFSSFKTGLCSPRHMKVQKGQLFVAEAGVGPQDPGTSNLCVRGLSSLNAAGLCFGTTGQVSAFPLDGSSAGEKLLTGLTSGRPPQGEFTNQVYGASAVDFDANGTMFTIIGLGFVSANDLAARESGLVFASVLRGDQVVAIPWVPLYENNYAGVDVLETNPFHMIIHKGITYVVDAGADLLYTYLNVTDAGTAEPDSVVVLPRIDDIPAVEPGSHGGSCNDEEPPPNGPAYCGQYNNNEGDWLYSTGAVPTAVRVNPTEPDRLYVSYLGGGPMWNEKVSGIFYMDLVDGIPQNDTLKVIKGHFYAVIDFGFYRNYLFVLETNPSGSAPFNGRLSRVALDSDEMTNMTTVILTDDLFQPVGLVIHEDTLFVSNNTFSMGMDDCYGQILKANLSLSVTKR